MSTKIATSVLLKIKVFWIKDYYVIYSVYDVNKILSDDPNYIVDVVMWPKSGNSSICIRSYHNINFTRIWPEKNPFMGGGGGGQLGWSSIIWDWHKVQTECNLEF